jgi:cardiolipin synthase
MARGLHGGLNIGAENILASHPRHPVQYLHFRFTGPVVRQMMTSFAEDWSFSTGERLEGDAWWPGIEPAGPVLARGIPSGPDEDAGSLEAVLGSAVAAARRRLRVVTPYFLPESSLAIALALAAARGVETDVIIPERSDSILLDWAMRAHIAFMRAPSLRFHFSPAPFDHSKVVTVDGAWSMVGSANWDVRASGSISSSWSNAMTRPRRADRQGDRGEDRGLRPFTPRAAAPADASDQAAPVPPTRLLIPLSA